RIRRKQVRPTHAISRVVRVGICIYELLLDRDAILHITAVLGDLSERGVLATRQHGHPHRRDYRQSENASSVHCIPPRSFHCRCPAPLETSAHPEGQLACEITLIFASRERAHYGRNWPDPAVSARTHASEATGG